MALVKIRLTAGKTDDPRFITVLNSLIHGLIAEPAPDEFWILQIDNWFDHKWLGFGMGLMTPNIQVEKLTFPPFTPNRVMGQFSYL